jgi:hypothetical protein
MGATHDARQDGTGLAQTALTALRTYADLTKPRLLPLVLFTGLPALGMAAGGWPSFGFAALTILGISLAAASANTLNAYLERDKDALMDRTRSRPLPMGRITPRAALRFGLVLGVAATALLYAVAGPAAAGLGVASILYYVFVYTVWAKPRSAWNAVIGAAAGGGGAGGGGPPPPPAPAQSGAADCLLHHLLQLALLVKLHRDVTTADQLAVDIDLREGRPVRVARQVLENFRVGQYVHMREFLPARGQRLGGTTGIPALRNLRRALHENDDRIVLHGSVDSIHYIHCFTLLNSKPG